MNTISQHLVNAIMNATTNYSESEVKYKLAMMDKYDINLLVRHPEVEAGLIKSQHETAMLLAE